MKTLAGLLKSTADESRLRILFLLEAGELCVCDIQEVLGLAQSTVSRHLQVLEEAGLIQARRQGLWKYYRFCELPRPAAQALLGLVRQEGARLPEAAEVRVKLEAVATRGTCGAAVAV
ncbi:MAG: metalloregulator ArsR/SmtB family transcription factor [Deferrisomatales bacterium]|nr:metalloregulator ArsR/SmtB family transcription factor [Deferrisomatales bacterium]